MSRYAVNKALWEVARDAAAAAIYVESPERFLEGRALSDEEHRQLLDRDFAGLFAAGAHPFLLFTFRIKVSGGWSYALMLEHVRALANIEAPLDIST